MSFRVVFDTNIIVSALIFSKASLTWLRDSWALETCIPIASTETAQELLRVLNYPKFKLTIEEQTELLGEFLPYVESVVIDTGVTGMLPECRDYHDQKFLTLALSAKSKFLVTGDSDLLILNNQVSFSIMTPSEFHEIIINSR